MDRGALRTALTSRLAIPVAGDNLLDPTTLVELLNAALRDLSNEADWPWLTQTAALTFTAGEAPVPADYVKALHLIVNSQPARYLPLGTFLEAKASGVQCVWTVIGAEIVLAPIPLTSPTNTLYYVRSEPTLTTDTATPLCPDLYHNTLIARAAYLANVRRANAEAAARDATDYERGVQKMKDAAWPRSGPRTIKPAGTALYASWSS